jgi:putative ABC transport system permease protein
MESLVAANIKQRPFRSLISAAGVALGVALVMMFTGLARGMSDDLKNRSTNVQAEIMFTRKGSMSLTGSSLNLDVEYAKLLREVNGVRDAVPVALHISQGRRGFGFQHIEGVDCDAYAKMNNIQLKEGRHPVNNNEVVIDSTKANDDSLKVGDNLELFGGKIYKIVGIFSPPSRARTKMTLGAMQDIMESSEKCTYVLVKIKDGFTQEDVAKNIMERFKANAEGIKIQFTKDVFTSLDKQIPALNTFLRVLVGLGAVVSALVVMLAMYTTITERTREIGILKALGASRGFIVSEIVKEALLISLIGLVAGFIVSIIASYFIHRNYGLIFDFGWGWTLTAALIGLLGGSLGALYPAVRAANLDPVNALAYE